MLNTISAVIVALATGVVGAWLGYSSSNREIDVKMIEIAVGILSQEPESNIAPAREWAVDVITRYADPKPSESVRKALVNNRVLRTGVFIRGDQEAVADPNNLATELVDPGRVIAPESAIAPAAAPAPEAAPAAEAVPAQ